MYRSQRPRVFTLNRKQITQITSFEGHNSDGGFFNVKIKFLNICSRLHLNYVMCWTNPHKSQFRYEFQSVFFFPDNVRAFLDVEIIIQDSKGDQQNSHLFLKDLGSSDYI